jgi:hypothetical protein
MPHLFPERRNIDRERQRLMVHSRAKLAKIGEANAEFQEFAKFMRRVAARRDADLVQRAPEAIAGMRIVMASVGGPLARGGADEDQSKMLVKLVRKSFHRVRPFRRSREASHSDAFQDRMHANRLPGGDTMKLRTIAAAMLALALSAGAAAAQPANSLKDQIVGSWNFVVAEVTAPDGKKSFPFGETPKGILIFTADGRFAQIHVAGDVPKIASNNRMTGTPEEYAAIMRRSLSVFGTWTVDEASKTVTYNIVSASFPNWEGEAQTRNIDKLTADEFVNTNPNVGGGRGSASNFYRRVK